MSNANEPDQINTGALSMMIALVTLATLGIALYVTALVREEVRELGGARMQPQESGIRELRAEQLAQLGASPTWVDSGKGVVSMPIESAMARVVEAVRTNPFALSPWVKPPEEADEPGAEDASTADAEAAEATGEGAGAESAAGSPAAVEGSAAVAAKSTKEASAVSDGAVVPPKAAPAVPKPAPQVKPAIPPGGSPSTPTGAPSAPTKAGAPPAVKTPPVPAAPAAPAATPAVP